MKITDLSVNTPKKLSELSRDNMARFILNKTAEEKEWYVNLLRDNPKKAKNNLTGEIIDTIDISTVRKAFAKKYFPELVEKKKKTTTKNKKPSYEDDLIAMVNNK